MRTPAAPRTLAGFVRSSGWLAKSGGLVPLFERRTKMGNIAVIMPVIGAIGFIVIVAIILVIRSKEQGEKGEDQER